MQTPLEKAPAGSYNPNRFKHVSQMSDTEATEYCMGNIRRAIANKNDDFIRNQRYLNIFKALDQPEDAIDESTGKISDNAAIYSNTYLPIGAAFVDTGAVQMFNQVFSTPDYMDLDADDFWDDLKALRIKAHLLKRHEEMKFKTTVFRALQSALTFDYAVTFDRWKVRWGNKPTRVRGVKNVTIGGMTLPYRENKMVMKPGVVISRCDTDTISYFNCAHDPDARYGFEDSDYFVDWRQASVWELLLEARGQREDQVPWGRYKNIDQLQANFEQGIGVFTSPNALPNVKQTKRDPFSERVYVFRYWTPDEVLEFCSDVCISRRPLDGFPLSLWKIYELPDTFPGMGILQRLERIQYDINAIINMKRDFQNLVLTPITAISQDLVGAEEGDVEIYPGKSFVSDRGSVKDKITFYQPQSNPTQGASEELATEIGIAKQVAGFDENAAGAYTSSARTARETSAVAAGLLTKLSAVAQRIEEMALVPTYQRQFTLEQMHLKRNEVFKYMGKGGVQWITINPEDYAWGARPRFSAKGSTYVQYRDIFFRNFMSGLALALKVPQLHNMEVLFAKMWQHLDPNDFQEYIRDPRNKGFKVPANVENFMAAHGQKLVVSPEDDHAAHIQTHKMFQNEADYRVWPEEYKRAFEQHIAEHEQAGAPQAMASGAAPTPMGQDGSDLERGLRGGNANTGPGGGGIAPLNIGVPNG